MVFLDPSAPAIEFDSAWWSWGDVVNTWEHLDATLHESGISTGAPIGVVLRNRPECVASILAMLGTGRCVVTLSPLQTDGYLAKELVNLGVSAIVAPKRDWGREGFEAAIGVNGALGLELGTDPGNLVKRVSRVSGAAALSRPGVAIDMLTSGTTGPPKRIPLPYGNLARSIEALVHYGPSGRNIEPQLRTSVSILFAPLSHISGSWGAIESTVGGRRLALLEQFKVDQWLELVRRHRPKFAALPPACIRMILDSGATKEDLDSLKAVRSGTAPLDPRVADEFEDRFGIPVLVVYGATEFAGAVVGWTLSDHVEFRSTKRGSAGRAHPGISVRIVDEGTGAILDPGEIGLLEFRGDQLKGLGSSEWVHTQDLAHIDKDGFVWIQGRNDDVILRGGFKVDAVRVGAIIESHPDVYAAAVVGAADRRLGAVPVAVIERSPGRNITAQELLNWVRQSLAVYEVPTRIIFVDHLPRTATLKVSKMELERLIESSTD